MTTRRKPGGLKRKRSPFEGIILLVALAGILGIVGGLVYYSVSNKAGPPDLRAVVRSEGGGKFTLVVTNHGGTTAEDVSIDVISSDETVEVDFPSVAKGDREEATILFEQAGADIRAEVKTFREP